MNIVKENSFRRGQEVSLDHMLAFRGQCFPSKCSRWMLLPFQFPHLYENLGDSLSLWSSNSTSVLSSSSMRRSACRESPRYTHPMLSCCFLLSSELLFFHFPRWFPFLPGKKKREEHAAETANHWTKSAFVSSF